MTLTEISNIRLYNQLIAKSSFESPNQVVRWMGAMQAQNYGMSKWAVGLRLQNSNEKQIEAAIDKGEIIRTHLLRPTWHLVAAEDVRWMMALSAPNIKKLTLPVYRQMELDDTVFKKSNSILYEILNGGNELTREEIRVEFEKEGIRTNELRVGHLMLRAETDMIVCNGARRGKQNTYALFNERVPESKPILKDEALIKLITIYFSSHGPATLKDFIWWSGLSALDAKHALEMVRSNFISEVVDLETYWFSPSGSYLTEDTSIHLLPAFDEFIISYKDRTASIKMENQSKAFTKNGIFNPVLIFKGQVIGIWKKLVDKKKIILQYEFFKPLSKYQQKMLALAEQRFNK